MHPRPTASAAGSPGPDLAEGGATATDVELLNDKSEVVGTGAVNGRDEYQNPVILVSDDLFDQVTRARAETGLLVAPVFREIDASGQIGRERRRCSRCGAVVWPQALMCQQCRTTFVGQAVRPAAPSDIKTAQTGYPVLPGMPTAARSRDKHSWRDPGPLASIGFGLVLLVWLGNFLIFRRPSLPLLLVEVLAVLIGISLAVRDNGFGGLGAAALVLGALSLIGIFHLMFTFYSPTKSFDEPIPPPPGHGFVVAAQDISGITHVYEGTKHPGVSLFASAPPQAIDDEMAQIENYYRATLPKHGWVLISSAQGSLTFEKSGSSEGLSVSTRWEPADNVPNVNTQTETDAIYLTITLLNCPSRGHCQPLIP